MNTLSKILFWTFTILIGFFNPLCSIAFVVVYYLPKIIQDISKSCNDIQDNSEMSSFSDDILEEMK